MQNERLLNKEPREQVSLFADLPLVENGPIQLKTSQLKTAQLEVEHRQSAKTDSAKRARVNSAQKRRGHTAGSPDHLAAAQQLAKKLRYGRRKPRTRQRAGIAICQHLIALLHEGEQAEQQQTN